MMNDISYVFRLEVSTTVWTIVSLIIAILILVIVLILAPILFFSIKVSTDKIRLGAFLTPSITVKREDVTLIDVIELNEHPELKPVMRLLGMGLPGYKLGWFKLANGSKAYLALSRWGDKAVAIKLVDGTYVIIAPKNFKEFILRLKELDWIK